MESYLKTVYEPDVDYVDGEFEDRHVGECDHTIAQRAILFWFYLREREWRIRSLQEQRTRVGATKVRLPDVSVFSRSTPSEQVFTQPQLIAIEVLSPEDRRSRVDKKIRNYIEFGVPHIRPVDPAKRIGWDRSDGSWTPTERRGLADLSSAAGVARQDRRRLGGLAR